MPLSIIVFIIALSDSKVVHVETKRATANNWVEFVSCMLLCSDDKSDILMCWSLSEIC